MRNTSLFEFTVLIVTYSLFFVNAAKRSASLTGGEISDIKGVKSSINETGPVFKTFDSNCGGIVIADKGIITFLSQPASYFTYFFLDKGTTCIWTVRGSRKEKIQFKLISFESNPKARGERPDTVITLQPALLPSHKLIHPDAVLMDGESEYIMDGPVVFVTLISSSKYTVPGFQLSFEALGDDAELLMSKYFVHYYYDWSTGAVDYPMDRGAEKYNPNEIATFVVNPNSLLERDIVLTFMDIEKSNYCSKDNLYFLFPKPCKEWIYNREGNSILDQGYCGRSYGYLNDRSFSRDTSFIAVFQSDSKNQFTGFKFTWHWLQLNPKNKKACDFV